jgi:uncharacterized protein YdhG (YjbR/CyaY superfamily)
MRAESHFSRPPNPLDGVERYLAAVSIEAMPTLIVLRNSIRTELPDATEWISYGIPVFKLDKAVVGYGAWRTHCGFYAMSGSVLGAFQDELTGYSVSKSTIRIPFGQALPQGLVSRIVKARISENVARRR